jgi:hypothetical protein
MIHSTEEFRAVVKAARRVGTPLLSVRTADPASAITRVCEGINGKKDPPPLLVWDFVGGFQGRNDAGKSGVAKVLGENSPGIAPGDVLAFAQRIAADSILFILNPHRVWEQPDVIQGIWNLRDIFKAGGQMLVLVTPPGTALPIELQNDVMVIDEPLPSTEDLSRLVDETFDSAGIAPDASTASKAVHALVGLAAFPAEQVLAMSLTKSGLDLDRLWERKCHAVEQTSGLTIWRGGETFDEIGGCENIKRFLTAVLHGREAPRVIVFVDEIEKAFAGTGTDMSGVKTEMTGTMLSWMQDRGADGLIFIGPPGTAKSAVGKAAGATVGIPTVAFDLSAMQDSLVGGSGERLRAALQVVDAISQGRSLWIATCNSITSLPPELRRRFTLGTFFFDLPSAEERAAIWNIYRTKWDLSGDLPDDDGWTGAEIKECCRKAWRLKLSLKESAEYIVPVSRSAADQIESLRRQATGRFLSGSTPGIFTLEPLQVPVGAGRRTFRSTE